MKHIERFSEMPTDMPASIEDVRTLLRLAFEEGDAGGAVKAYENVADQLAEIPGAEPMTHELRRWAGSLKGRARRAHSDLAANGWPQ